MRGSRIRFVYNIYEPCKWMKYGCVNTKNECSVVSDDRPIFQAGWGTGRKAEVTVEILVYE